MQNKKRKTKNASKKAEIRKKMKTVTNCHMQAQKITKLKKKKFEKQELNDQNKKKKIKIDFFYNEQLISIFRR